MLRHVARFKAFKRRAQPATVVRALDALARAANSEGENVFEKVVEATEAGVTHGEIVELPPPRTRLRTPLIVA